MMIGTPALSEQVITFGTAVGTSLFTNAFPYATAHNLNSVSQSTPTHCTLCDSLLIEDQCTNCHSALYARWLVKIVLARVLLKMLLNPKQTNQLTMC